jgi:ubiquinone/menaquinone biosynthesis C-methylase UbiE
MMQMAVFMSSRSHRRLTWSLAALAVSLAAASLSAQRTAAPENLPTERIFAALKLQDGMTVCEIGAGDGELSIAVAKIVGASGRVYTSELGDDRVESLRAAVKKSELSQITVVAGDPTDTKFPDEACDALFMRNVYHHFADPAAMNASIFKSLEPGGRLAVVDFTPPGKEADQPGDRSKDGMHGVSADSVARELKAAGFSIGDTVGGSNRWFMVVAMKPAL